MTFSILFKVMIIQPLNNLKMV